MPLKHSWQICPRNKDAADKNDQEFHPVIDRQGIEMSRTSAFDVGLIDTLRRFKVQLSLKSQTGLNTKRSSG